MQKELGKILFLTIDFPPLGGGMSRHSYNTAVALSRQKEPVVVLTIGEGFPIEAETEKCFSILRLKNLHPHNIFERYARSVGIFFFSAFRFCSAHKVRIVLANTWSITGVCAYLIKAFLGIPYIVFAHGFDVYSPRKSRKVRWLMKLILKNSCLVIVNSNFTKGLIREIIPEDKIAVLHPAIEVSEFSPGAQQKNTPERKIILTVGRLVESKGHEAVIRAFPGVLERFPEALYQIVGEGPMEGALKELAKQLGLAEKVIFIKNADDQALAAYYSSCDVFVMPSREILQRGEVEGFGMVFLEAGAWGKPVVAGKSGGIPDAVVDGQTGILIDPFSPQEISVAVIRLFSDREAAGRMGENARTRVMQEFNLNKFGEKLNKIIGNALEN